MKVTILNENDGRVYRPQTERERLIADSVKFLELLLSECGTGPTDHEWRKCRRCLAINELESHQPLARGFVKQALAALRAPDLRGWVQHTWDCAKRRTMGYTETVVGTVMHPIDPPPCSCGLDAALTDKTGEA